jgi:hypothetical protein
MTKREGKLRKKLVEIGGGHPVEQVPGTRHGQVLSHHLSLLPIRLVSCQLGILHYPGGCIAIVLSLGQSLPHPPPMDSRS